MENHDESFTPHVHEQEIVHQFSQLSEENAQLVKDLRAHYALVRARNAHMLEHAWERIQREHDSIARHGVRSRQEKEFGRALHLIERAGRRHERQTGSQQPGWLKHLIRGLMAAVLMTVLVGSLVLVYGSFQAYPHPGSSKPGDQSSATAIHDQHIDGYEPAGAMTTNRHGSLNWPVGQSTYWANLRYHQLTGYWVSWVGSASQWVAGARAAGWEISQSPHTPSIIVLMPGVQGASSYGHVAVVEKINTDGTVLTSNMNWVQHGGGWDRVSYANFTLGAGVLFIFHP